MDLACLLKSFLIFFTGSRWAFFYGSCARMYQNCGFWNRFALRCLRYLTCYITSFGKRNTYNITFFCCYLQVDLVFLLEQSPKPVGVVKEQGWLAFTHLNILLVLLFLKNAFFWLKCDAAPSTGIQSTWSVY